MDQMYRNLHVLGKIHMLARMYLASALCLAAATAQAQPQRPHNLIIFVADGLRSEIVEQETAPNLAALRMAGVDFCNSHSLYPTITTPNASTIATGHLIGDTGNFGNSLYVAFPTPSAAGSTVPFLENDAVLNDVEEHFDGNYLNETSLLAAAQSAGFQVASIGKLGPTAIQALTARAGERPIIIDDATGRPNGIPLAPPIAAAIEAVGLPIEAPSRGANGAPGNATTAGTVSANIIQQAWFSAVAGQVILPRFKAAGRPFVLVYWSRDPDGTQHNQGDSLNQLKPGINGPTTMAAIRNADNNLATLRQALKTLGLASETDILVTADHGFSTIDKSSATSPSARYTYADVPTGQLPPGFLAIDLAHALGQPLFDADGTKAAILAIKGQHPVTGSGLIGPDPEHPNLIVAANGGTDLIYMPQGRDRVLAHRVVRALMAQDYTSVIFLDDHLGRIRGTLPLSAVGLQGAALTPHPSIVVGFRSRTTGCANPEVCAAEVADTNLRQGQGMHGTFSRADTHNFMAAIGPDFKSGFVDPAPTSNADIGRTAAELLGLKIAPKGTLIGRVLSEALVGGKPVAVSHATMRAVPGYSGFDPILKTQRVEGETYFDAAGIPARTVGLQPPPR
jgi:arylsulfatase A-like enzyme